MFGVDDRTALIASIIAQRLGLPSPPVAAVRAAGDKHQQRVLLQQAGVRVPHFERRPFEGSRLPIELAYPLVVKPLRLAASRGVMRVDDKAGVAAAMTRLRAILALPDVVAESGDADAILIEEFVAGPEFAVEGLVRDGELHVLALFDKPDPLDGPFFPETIYVTPSRQPAAVQRALSRCTAEAVRALGLSRGPVHAELRFNESGAWLIELAARPIGGKCGQALRFGASGATSLEQLHLAHALDLSTEVPPLAPGAHGVRMLPIPRGGVFEGVRGIEDAKAIPGVSDVLVSIPVGARVRPLPEDARYLGFVFAHGATPAAVERALRDAGDALTVEVRD